MALSGPRETSEVPNISRYIKKQGSCGSANCACHKKTRLLGPGTIVAVAAAVVIVIVGFTGSHGNLAPVHGNVPAPARPLWKPEPAAILTNAKLALRPDQRSGIETISKAWLKEKSELVQAMSAYQPRQAQIEQLKADLADYSALSRQFDKERHQAWSRAVAVLDADQKLLIEGGAK